MAQEPEDTENLEKLMEDDDESLADAIWNTWFCQYIFNKGLERGELKASRQMVLTIIQAHFPEMTQLAQKAVSQITDFQQLQGLIVKVSFARDSAAEVERLFSALSNKVD